MQENLAPGNKRSNMIINIAFLKQSSLSVVVSKLGECLFLSYISRLIKAKSKLWPGFCHVCHHDFGMTACLRRCASTSCWRGSQRGDGKRAGRNPLHHHGASARIHRETNAQWVARYTAMLARKNILCL